MEKQSEFGPAPPSYNEATAPSCTNEPQPYPQPPQQPYPQAQHEPLLQQPPYPQVHQPQPYPEPVKQQPYPQPQLQPPYPTQQPYPQQPYPQPQQPYPPQSSSMPQPMVINMPACQVPVSLGVCAVHMVCPNCRNQIMTSVSTDTREADSCSFENNVACFIMFILGIFLVFTTWFCSCLPYIFNPGKSSTTYRHSCPRCNVLLGTFAQ